MKKGYPNNCGQSRKRQTTYINFKNIVKTKTKAQKLHLTGIFGGVATS